jgi:hypothetical protein
LSAIVGRRETAVLALMVIGFLQEDQKSGRIVTTPRQTFIGPMPIIPVSVYRPSGRAPTDRDKNL